jgi:hypothetical protein
MTSSMKIEGKTFRIMGVSPKNAAALPQAGLEVTPTRSVSTFDGKGYG